MKTWSFGTVDSSGQLLVEPDLRQEFLDLIKGGSGEKSRGHWIVFRKSDIARRSQYWNAETKEAIGGPPFEYVDYLMRARYRSFSAGEEEYRDMMGLIERPIRTYYIDYRLKPKKEDYILEVTNSDSVTAPSGFKVTAKYNIILVDEPRDDHGRIEYYVCMCQKELSKGDKTLENISIMETL